MTLILLGLIGGGLITYIASLNWRRAVMAALVIVVLEGVLRKWVLLQASEVIFFLKDFVLLGAYLSFFCNSSIPKKRIPYRDTIKLLLSLFTVWALVQVFNPALGSPIIGIVGLKNYFIYVPLIWLIPALFDSEEDLYKFLRTYLLILIPVALLAIAQFLSPPDSPLNVYARETSFGGVAMIGDSGLVRVTGTFSYTNGYNALISTCFALLLPLVTREQPKVWLGLAFLELSLIGTTLFMTGSRGTAIKLIFILVSYVVVQGIVHFRTVLRFSINLVIPTLIAVFLLTYQYNAAFEAYASRVESNSDLPNRIQDIFLQPFTFSTEQQFGGYGTGATYQANGFIRSLLDLPPGDPIYVSYEGEIGRIIIELGWFGFTLWFAFRGMILFAIWQTYRKLQTPFLKHLALSIFFVQLISLSGGVVFHHIPSLYHWFFNGLVFLLPHLETNSLNRISLQKAYYESNSNFPRSPNG